jgi:hypothetical protein
MMCLSAGEAVPTNQVEAYLVNVGEGGVDQGS